MLAPQFIQFAGLKDRERILEVGCGTGSLTFAMPKAGNVAEVVAINYATTFVEEVKRLGEHTRSSVQQAAASMDRAPLLQSLGPTEV